MKRKLIFANSIPEQFNDLEDYVHEIINAFFDNMDVNCKVTIEFITSASHNSYEVTDCMLLSSSAKKHKLQITNSVLNSIYKDNGEFFCTVIYHEFEHIRDHVKMKETGLFNFNLTKRFQKKLEWHYIHVAFLFWTEIDAYYKTILFAKHENIRYEKIPFGNLVKAYKKTINHDKRIYYKQDLTYDEAVEYIDCVDSFVYLCAKHMASLYAGHSRFPDTAVAKNKDFKKVAQILSKLEPKVKNLLKNPYCAKSYKNLAKLGETICYNINFKIFHVGLIKNKGVFTTCY